MFNRDLYKLQQLRSGIAGLPVYSTSSTRINLDLDGLPLWMDCLGCGFSIYQVRSLPQRPTWPPSFKTPRQPRREVKCN